MTIVRIYKTDPYKGLKDFGTVDFIFDEDDEYAGLDDYDNEPYARDVIREETEYDHVDHSAEIVTAEDIAEELEAKRNVVADALQSATAR